MASDVYKLWSRPLVASENVVAVTVGALVLGRVPLKELPAFEANLSRAADPPGAIILPLTDLREVIVGVTGPMFQVLHGSGPTMTEVFLENNTVRDEVLTELARRLGPGWKLHDRDYTQATTLGVFFALLLPVSVIVYFVTRHSEAKTDTTGFEFLADTAGSVGVLIIGLALNLLVAAGIVWSVWYPPKAASLQLTRIV